MTKRFLFSIAFISIAMAIGIAGYLYFIKQQPALAAGNIINAASCNQADVQAAINMAVDGDTVTVPAGSCVWATGITVFEKGIIFQGAGIDNTILSDATGSSTQLLKFIINPNKRIRISGFTFAGNKGSNYKTFVISGSGNNWRIDHNKFTANQQHIWIIGEAYGVIDHNIFEPSAGKPVVGVELVGNDFATWQKPQTWGDGKAVFIEDNIFKYAVYQAGSGVMDGKGGGRGVFRHNTVTNNDVSIHGFDSSNGAGWQSAEVYNNKLDFTLSFATVFGLRGGTALVYDNIVTGNVGNGMILRSYRACCAGRGTICGSKGVCDGTLYKLCSNVSLDGSVNGTIRTCTQDSECVSPNICNRMFCSATKDKVCTVNNDCPIGEVCNGYVDQGTADVYGYPGRDQVGRSTNQKLSPVYEWNNTRNGIDMDWTIETENGCAIVPPDPHPVPSDHIKEGRDFFNDTPLPGYTPYTYPHPLTLSASVNLKSDFNSDSKVNNIDFTVFKNAFKSLFNSLFDLNSDNAIDVKDLGVLMSSWSL